jgi:hypothetical protein
MTRFSSGLSVPSDPAAAVADMKFLLCYKTVRGDLPALIRRANPNDALAYYYFIISGRHRRLCCRLMTAAHRHLDLV